jgi:hypothetical protein
MGFSQMGHLVKSNIKIDIINQNDQCYLIKRDTYAYYIPTSYLPPTHLNVLPTYLFS